MRDLHEGRNEGGSITTGVDRRAVPAEFEPVLAALAELTDAAEVTTCLYGSVATGRCRTGLSDVDLLTVGLSPAAAAEISRDLSARFRPLCRGVEVASAQAADLAGRGDEAYGLRVFLKHYCVHLGGPDLAAGLPTFPADARAARGFNGDIGRHLTTWRAIAGETAAEPLGRRVARKTLLAVGGLVSVIDTTWTTDRAWAADRFGELRPELAPDLRLLSEWAVGLDAPSPTAVRRVLQQGGIVESVVAEFALEVGLWTERTDPGRVHRSAATDGFRARSESIPAESAEGAE